MGIVTVSELPRERAASGKFKESFRYTRGFMVRLDDPTTPLTDISQAPGIQFLDPHPDDASCVAMEFSAKPESNSLLHYTITVQYYAKPTTPGEDADDKPPELLPGIPTLWTATSSVGTAQLVTDINGVPIKNSAGTPIPDLSCDVAKFKLSLKRPWMDMSWQTLARQYTNAVNSDTWMGAGPRCWKCQGWSASPETQNEAGITRSYWMCSIDFEYQAPKKKGGTGTEYPGWDMGVTDKGYQAKVDDSGHPDPSPSSKIGTIRDAKGQPIKEPVGLKNGEAVTPPADPDTLVFQIYRALPFRSVFGV